MVCDILCLILGTGPIYISGTVTSSKEGGGGNVYNTMHIRDGFIGTAECRSPLVYLVIVQSSGLGVCT